MDEEKLTATIKEAIAMALDSGLNQELIVKALIEGMSLNNLDIKSLNDKHHNFKDYLKQRTIILAWACNSNPSLCWKSKKHYDEENDPMFNGDFVVGINTSLGYSTFHIKLEYWDLFLIPEIERAYPYDGHSPEENIQRILSLIPKK